jgi:murein L,D-transpeptidase YafK
MTQTLANDLIDLRGLKAARDALKEEYDEADKRFRKKQEQVLNRMELEETESQKVDGTLFVPTETVYGQVQDRAAFLEWAQDNDEELFERKERAQLVNQLVREKLDNGEALPPGITFYVRKYIGQRAG